MEKVYIESKSFERVDFTENILAKGDYEHCTFVNCNFSNVDLSSINFSECLFENCNLTMVKVVKTAFRDIKFKGCKLLGVHFQNCNAFLFSASFDDCILNLSSFYKMSLKKMQFKHCSLQEVDFAEADLTGALLFHCDLLNATFDRTNLEKADFRTAVHYLIDPEKNKMKKAKFSLAGVNGLLYKYDIEIE